MSPLTLWTFIGSLTTWFIQAGLFSAVLTAFNVESYPLLQPPATDPSLDVLRQIAAQLQAPYGNATQPAFVQPGPDAASRFDIPQSAIVLNILWFSSLILSLSTATIGIMVKQWTHEFRVGLSGSSMELARLRQLRLNRLIKWRVASIVALLPLLLQLSLVLFFIGLLVLLWSLHATVALQATVLVGVVVTFIFGAPILAAFSGDCAFVSPPTHVLFYIFRRIKAHRILSPVWWVLHNASYHVGQIRVLPGWIREHLSRLQHWAYNARRTWLLTWRVKEKYHVALDVMQLDVDMMVTAYDVTMDERFLSHTAALDLCGHGSRVDFQECMSLIDKIQVIEKQHWSLGGVYHLSHQDATTFWTLLLLLSLSLPSDPRHWTLARTVLKRINLPLYPLDSASLRRNDHVLLGLTVLVDSGWGDTMDTIYDVYMLVRPFLCRPVQDERLRPWNHLRRCEFFLMRPHITSRLT